MKKLALFDIDRTLAENSIGVCFINYLQRKGKFPLEQYQSINKAVRDNKAGRISYTTRGRIIIENWAQGLRGWTKQELEAQAQQFFREEHAKRVYPGAKKLVSFLKKNHYLVVGISRAFEECLLPLQRTLGISTVIGTQFQYDAHGKCTGKLLNRMWLAGAKQQELMRLFPRYNLTTEDSLAFGDTEDDYYMLKFVKYPITVNANSTLEKIAFQKHWPAYHDLLRVLGDMQSGKLLPKTDWFGHYAKKYGYIIIDARRIKDSLRNDQPFVALMRRFIPHGSSIVEAGCGLGRLAISLSQAGYAVTAIDNDKEILEAAKINCSNFGKNVHLELADIFDLDHRFRSRKFAAVTHGGVLEHFSDNQMKIILDKQLKLAPLVLFSVPVHSARNARYFQADSMGHRNLWSKAQWKNFLQSYYTVKALKTVHATRKDDLLVVITAKHHTKK